MKTSENIKKEILQKVEDYYFQKKYEEICENTEDNKVPYAGRVYDQKELEILVNASLNFYLTKDYYCNLFEKDFSSYLGVSYSCFVNSGSSANFLAFMALTSYSLGDKRIKRGDEVITVACGFPTTITPILYYGAIPVFCDIELDTLNIDTSYLEKALTTKTKAVMLAHTLGNPFDIEKVKQFCDKNNLWLISDECDALGSKYKNKHLNNYADISTHSFFPAHIITTGQGGMVCTNNKKLYNIIKSIRDWGRDYKCDACVNFCDKRYKNNKNDIEDYDCRYCYSELGVNFQTTEMQGAIGVEQLKKADWFISVRKYNFNLIYRLLIDLKEYLILPRINENTDPSWFGFWITIKNTKFKRIDLINYLNNKNIDTRMIFAGNIIKQRLFSNLKEGVDYKVIGDLKNSDYIANNCFFIGVYPGLNREKIIYMCKHIIDFFNKNT